MKPWIYTRRRRRRPALSSLGGPRDNDCADMERASRLAVGMSEGPGRACAAGSLRGGRGGGDGALPLSASRVYGGGGDCEGDAMDDVGVIVNGIKGHCTHCMLWDGGGKVERGLGCGRNRSTSDDVGKRGGCCECVWGVRWRSGARLLG